MNSLARSLLIALVAFTSAAHAQPWPAKPIKLIVPFPAGGPTDLVGREAANILRNALGQAVIVENRPGAGGTVGTGFVAKAAPDGNTMVLAAASHNIAGSLYTKLAYDPQKDFTPMAHVGSAGYVLMIHPDVPARTAAEFIRYAKANPGKMNYATAGVGSATGIDMVHVPLKATGEAINEVLSGRAHAVIAASIGALSFVKDSRIRLLGVTSLTRSKYLPEVASLAESGLPGYEFDSWFGLLGPAGVAKAEAERVNAAMGTLLKSPVILERLDKQGIEATILLPSFGVVPGLALDLTTVDEIGVA